MHPVTICRAWPLALALLVLGCGKSTDPAKPGGPVSADQAPIKKAFGALQVALQSEDGERIWPLLDSQSQKDADAAARAWKQAYADADVIQLEQDLGIGRQVLVQLTGRNFLQTKGFLTKSIVDLSKSTVIESIKVDGDQATVDYRDPHGQAGQVTFVREGNQWKARLKMERPRP
jgi:hypothetical protein